MTPAVAIVQPIEDVLSLKDRTYDALKQAITAMDIYASPGRTPAGRARICPNSLVSSRTPIREAIARLEQEGAGCGLCRRRGVFVVRKPKREILQMITGLGRAGKHGGTG